MGKHSSEADGHSSSKLQRKLQARPQGGLACDYRAFLSVAVKLEHELNLNISLKTLEERIVNHVYVHTDTQVRNHSDLSVKSITVL